MDFELIQKNSGIDMGATESGLRTAVTISLFTDKRVSENELPEWEDNKRGFWADAIEGNKIGSKLWLLNRGKVDRETKALCQEYALEALQWMIEDRLVRDISAIAYFEDNNLKLEIELTLPSKKSITQNYHKIISGERTRGNS